jgi:hypothetical protein
VNFSFQPHTVYLKTPQGRAEVAARALGLTILQRRLLILSDGKATVGQLQTILGAQTDDLLQHLLNLGLLQLLQGAAAPIAPAVAPAPAGVEADEDDDAHEDHLNSDFSEVMGADSISHFERDSSQMIGTHTDPSSTLQRAITSRGITLGRAYLINLSSRLLDARDARLVRSISQIKTEGDLYHQFELVIDTISNRLGSSAINEILEQFDEQINQA